MTGWYWIKVGLILIFCYRSGAFWGYVLTLGSPNYIKNWSVHNPTNDAPPSKLRHSVVKNAFMPKNINNKLIKYQTCSLKSISMNEDKWIFPFYATIFS